MKRAMGNVQAEFEGAAVGSPRLQGERRRAETLSRSMENDALRIVREPDDDGQFLDRFARRYFDIHPGSFSGLKRGLFTETVAQGHFVDIDRLFFRRNICRRSAAEVSPHDLVGAVDRHYLALLEQHGALTDFADRFEVVRNEQDGGSTLDDRANAVNAALLKNEVTDAQDFIDNEDFGITWAATEKPRRAYIPEE